MLYIVFRIASLQKQLLISPVFLGFQLLLCICSALDAVGATHSSLWVVVLTIITTIIINNSVSKDTFLLCCLMRISTLKNSLV